MVIVGRGFLIGILLVGGAWTLGRTSRGAPSAPTLPAPAGAVRSAIANPSPAGDVFGRAVRAPVAPAKASADPRPPATEPGQVDVPVCRYADAPAPHAGLDEWASTIVDTIGELPEGYVPPDLVPVGRAGIAGGGLVRAIVIDDLRALADAAAHAGNPLAVQSAYRSRTRQAEVFGAWVARSGEAEARRFSARPGHSEHQLGTAIDLRAAAGGAPWSGSFGSTAAGRWLREHAPAFGFVLSYPAGAESLTCYGAEPWHIRYVGRERAAAVAASGLTLREWLWSNVGD